MASQPPLQIPDAVLNGPSMKPPPGVVPNFEHPWNLNSIALLTNALCLTATILACSMRAYVKLFCARRAELEDVIMLFALGTYSASVWCAYRVIDTSGSFTHQWDIRLKDLSSTFYIHHLGVNFVTVTLGLSKVALILEWTRIFVPYGTRNLFYWVYKALLAFVCLSYSAFLVAENLSCIPHERIWDRIILSGYCIDDRAFHIPGASIAPPVILIILILSQNAIWNLRMSLNNKIGISLLFLVGILALGSSIARAIATFAYLHSDDKTHTLSAVYLWTLAELTCTFLAFCAPTIPRAYANRFIITNFIEYLKTSVGMKPRGSRMEARSWPSPLPSSTKTKRWGTPKRYHRIQGATSSLARHQTAKLAGQRQPMPENAILVTTSFTAEVTRLTDPNYDHVTGTESDWAYDRP
ncbi:hypothetical protein ANO14919_105980 [Xylariales sp. No.14919]|nr:hypothetical protein ANO14919_105980 [Xylariales sp. No.14919]